ncbi:hypothetical protein ACQJBY_064573 [Aegilops geniculata]
MRPRPAMTDHGKCTTGSTSSGPDPPCPVVDTAGHAHPSPFPHLYSEAIDEEPASPPTSSLGHKEGSGSRERLPPCLACSLAAGPDGSSRLPRIGAPPGLSSPSIPVTLPSP